MHPAPVADVEAIAALRHDLTDYTLHNVAELVGPTATAALHRDQRVPARRALAKPLADGNPLAGIVSCFMLADPISRNMVETMFPTLGLDGALELNIVTMKSHDEVLATVDLSAYATDRPGNLWVASDQTALQLRAPIPAEHILGIVRCFMLADPISRNMVETMFPTLGLDGALELNIVTMKSHDEVLATVDLSAYATDRPGNLWVASDQTALQLGAPIPAEHILGIGEASLTLASLTPRDRVEAGLDIGTGCGVQAMHLLTHADHVTITDISARALDFAVFNILLNAPALEVDPHHLAERVTVAQGNMLEPVAGQRFELVVTNPPFVIAPVSASVKHTYRETGRTGDLLVEELISTIDTVLTDGGAAVVLANWEIYGGENQSWHSRLETWPARGMDIWPIQRCSADPAQYAGMWLQDSSVHLDPNGYDAAYANSLTDFGTRGVTQIGFGWVWLRI